MIDGELYRYSQNYDLIVDVLQLALVTDDFPLAVALMVKETVNA